MHARIRPYLSLKTVFTLNTIAVNSGKARDADVGKCGENEMTFVFETHWWKHNLILCTRLHWPLCNYIGETFPPRFV